MLQLHDLLDFAFDGTFLFSVLKLLKYYRLEI